MAHLEESMERKVLGFEDGTGDGAQFTTKVDGLYVHCHCDWCGDSETGYGAEVGYNLTIQEAKKLHDFLGEWLLSFTEIEKA